MNNYGELLTPTTLLFTRLLPGPIDRVWDFITDAEKRSKWFCGGTSGLVPNQEFKFVFHNSTLGSPPVDTPAKYKEYGEGFESPARVIKAEKPSLFIIEWEGIVTFKLEEVDDKVKLTLTHENLADTPETRIGTLAGWHTHLDILVDVSNNNEAKSFWTQHMKLEDEYEARLA